MKLTMRVPLLVLVALGLLAGTAFAQFTAKKIWTLTVRVNAPNAVVWVDNELAPGGTTKVAGGAHNVKVHADGYADFNGPVQVRGNMTFPVNLRPLGFPLTVRVPVAGARILIDGAEVTGMVPVVAPGPHQVQVTAPGFLPYVATVNVAGPMSFAVALQPALHLVINVNVPGASILVDDAPIQGNVAYVGRGPHRLLVHADGYHDWSGVVNVLNSMTFAVRLNAAGYPLIIRVGEPGASVFVDGAEVTGTVPAVAPGTHTIRVTAPGFREYNATVHVVGPMTMDVAMQPAVSMLTFVIPPAFRDPEVRAGDPRGLVKIYVDGRLVDPRGQMEGVPVAPGRHSIRVASGAFTAALGELMVQPGRSYVVELTMGLVVRPAP